MFCFNCVVEFIFHICEGDRGAIANYLAGVIADQTSQASFDAAGAVNYSIDAYITVFSQITWGALACVGVVLVIWLYHSLKVRTRRLAVE